MLQLLGRKGSLVNALMIALCVTSLPVLRLQTNSISLLAGLLWQQWFIEACGRLHAHRQSLVCAMRHV